ncbi:MAG: alpha-amylase family glycosyl hydrolase [Bacteroidales bacterium]|nr:alpha-amylase family glycosyl hydrolase [Bacteroidales bacterium]
MKKEKRDKILPMVKKDPWLEPAEQEIADRLTRYQNAMQEIGQSWGSLNKFANAWQFYGFNYDSKLKGWFYREWAPHAQDLYLFGDFNGWQRYSHRLTPNKSGQWEIFLPDARYKDLFIHQSKVKVLVHSDTGWNEKIPAYIRRVVQDTNGVNFSGQHWAPPQPFDWEGDHFDIGSLDSLLIYECHIGMAMEQARVGTFAEFAEYILPYIKNSGYNTIQLMAIAEHPYYGSFGYHVTNFFAVSSRFGTPEELKYLIRKAHEQGIAVIMDVVHSHAAKNTLEGLNQFDGSDDQYFHPGPRGNHPQWDSKCFNYGKREVLRFLLSNLKFWLREFHFDGFRFDGVTSMMYFDHGYREKWDLDGYFKDGVEWDALIYLQLANTLVHKTKSHAVTIAEDVTGMPGLCRPISEGGIGFDYRLGMAIPDYWIKVLKEKKDEEWNLYEMWDVLTNRLPDVKTVAYCESHDQAMVGDQTIAFRLMQSEIYFKMNRKDESYIIDRGIALHKMIRLVTIALGGQAYLNFMGNEFGHPDWIDFPREGNNWSFQYARRQWSLIQNPDLKFRFLAAFDRAMLKMVEKSNLFDVVYGDQLNIDAMNQTLTFERRKLIFIFNFHTTNSLFDYGFRVPEPGDYRIILNSDNLDFGGQGRVDETLTYTTLYHEEDKTHHLMVYNPNRTAMVFERIG